MMLRITRTKRKRPTLRQVAGTVIYNDIRETEGITFSNRDFKQGIVINAAQLRPAVRINLTEMQTAHCLELSDSNGGRYILQRFAK